MDREYDFAVDLIEFIHKSPSPFHVVHTIESMLKARDFKKLELSSNWRLNPLEKYYIVINHSMIVGFVVGKKPIYETGFRIVASHTDSPMIVIKPDPEIETEGYLKLNCECYGGPILSTWMDRPLGIAGRVILKGKDIFAPKSELVTIDKPLVVIPNLAIHLNRNVNEGIKIDVQKEMLPILKTIEKRFEKKDFLLCQVANHLNVKREDIVDFELNLYEYEKGCTFGCSDEFISASRLDNLAMAHSSLEALLDADASDATNVFVSFNHEEIGSTTLEGAGSPTFQNILERISLATDNDRENYFRALSQSFMLSCDMVHALHPNYLEKQDPTNKPLINSGPAIKISARKSYTTDAATYSIYKEICERAGVNLQRFLNHSNERGGSTIGPISSTQIPIRSADIGNPLLGMHSIREMSGVKDHYDIYRSFIEFYKA